jgi:hypothetical protein
VTHHSNQSNRPFGEIIGGENEGLIDPLDREFAAQDAAG